MNSPRKGRIRIREVTDPKDPAIGPTYALLKRAFSVNERVPVAEWRASLLERVRGVWSQFTWHLIVAERDDRVIGLATGTYLGSVNVGMIGYLATARGTRAMGVGTRLRAKLRDHFRRDAKAALGRDLDAVLGEVSSKNPWLGRLARQPRVLVLDIPYFQPRLFPDDEPSPFMLYYESIEQETRSIAVSHLRRLLFAIWRDSYRVSRPLSRPAFKQMMKALEGRRRIGPHPEFQRRS
jgi:hypothetical protein